MSNILFVGGGRSLGSYLVEQLLGQEHSVYVVDQTGIVDYVTDLREAGEVTVQKIFDDAEDALHGAVDTVINNVGATSLSYSSNLDMNEFETLVKLNLTVPVMFCRELLFRMADYREMNIPARIVNTTSMAAHVAATASVGYCSSKAGLEMATKVMAKENPNRLIACCIAPASLSDSAMREQVIHEMQEVRSYSAEDSKTKFDCDNNMGRTATFKEAWELYNFAVNSMPAYMSGCVLTMPGASGI